MTLDDLFYFGFFVFGNSRDLSSIVLMLKDKGTKTLLGIGRYGERHQVRIANYHLVNMSELYLKETRVNDDNLPYHYVINLLMHSGF